MSGFNFGVDQNDIMLTMVSFASQHEFFNLLHLGAQGTLGWLTYTAGLVGFILLVFMPASWTPKVIASWLALFIIVLVRPLGDPLFFTDPTIDGSVSHVDSTICVGNVLTGRECEATNEGAGIDIEGLRAGEVATNNAPIELSDERNTFKVFSPQAALIDVINDLHYGIATQLNGLGPRVLDRQFSALETIRRNADGNTMSSYALADFLATCGSRSPEMARVASTRSDSIAESNPDLWTEMARTQMVFADGIQMFRNHDAFIRTKSGEEQQSLYPTLICAPDTCNENGATNAYDDDPAKVVNEEDFNRFNQSILFNTTADFSRFRSLGGEGEDGEVLPSAVDEANANITNAFSGFGEDGVRRLLGQKVTLVVPLNIEATGRMGNAGDLTSYRTLYEKWDNAWGMDEGSIEARDQRCEAFSQRTSSLDSGRGTGFDKVVGFFQGAANLIDEGACRLENSVVNIVRGGALSLADAALHPYIGPKFEFDNDEPAYIVNNCAQLHIVTNIRHQMASADMIDFESDLRELLEENEDLLATMDFEGLPPREQTSVVLQTILESMEHACEQEGVNSQECQRNKIGTVQQMIQYNNELAGSSSHAGARVMLEDISRPEMIAPSRNFAVWAGENTADLLIGLKAMIGGYGSGTYSEIMPRIVTFATSLIIILTPLIFMIGLAMPTWSFGILVMSVVVIAYFQLTKVVFTMISIIMSVFVASRESGIISFEMGNMADLVVGTAYTSAFLLTGLFMFSLKNPLAAIQQVAGAADKASTVSGAEALAAAMTVVKGAKVVAGVATGGAGAAAALGSMGGGGGKDGGGGGGIGDVLSGAMAGYSEGKKGGLGGLISGDSAKAARDASMSKIAANNADRLEAQKPPKTQEHFNDVELGRRMKADSEESVLVAKANGYSSAFKDEEAIVETNGHKHGIKVDGKGASIESAFQKIGKNGEPVREVMRAKQLNEGAKTIKDSGGREGRVEHKYDISVFEKNSSATRGDFQQMAEKQLGKLLDASGDITTDINKATHFLRVESKGAGGED